MVCASYKLAILIAVVLQLFFSLDVKANSVSDEALLRTVGDKLYSKEKWTGAEVVFRKLIEICPKDYFARKKLVKALLAQGKATQAIDMAKQLVVQQPKEPESYYLLGKCFDQAGCYKDALQDYKQSHTLCAKNLNYVLAIVNVYRKTGRALDAIDLLKSTLKEHQQMSLLWGYLFESAVDAHNINMAQAALQKFCKLIRKERIRKKQKEDLIASGWRMIALDCWRVSSYRDQLLLCYSLDESVQATYLIEAAKKKFQDRPDVFILLSQVIPDNTITDESERHSEIWTGYKKWLESIRKQAEKQTFASN